jgi:hypothetical protein
MSFDAPPIIVAGKLPPIDVIRKAQMTFGLRTARRQDSGALPHRLLEFRSGLRLAATLL